MGVAKGTAEHAACCAAAAGTTARFLVTSPMVVYDSSPPWCPHAPCLRVGGLVPQGGRQRTYHPPLPALVVKPLQEVSPPSLPCATEPLCPDLPHHSASPEIRKSGFHFRGGGVNGAPQNWVGGFRKRARLTGPLTMNSAAKGANFFFGH